MSQPTDFKYFDSIKFGILSPSEIRKMSVVEIISEETYDEDGLPISAGVMDLRLGTIEPRQRCKTCGNTAQNCPGHFGHIELPVPVIHVGFAKTIHQLLSATCRSCGRILLSDQKIAEYKKAMAQSLEELGEIPKRFSMQILRDAKKMSRCPHCGADQYVIQFTHPTNYNEASPDGVATKLTPGMIRERLERISDEDCILLGIDPKVARPEWMVLQVIPVPPVFVRPSITLESGERSEDDLTHKLVDIVRTARRVREYLESGASPLIVQDHADLLQYHVTTYIDNEASGVPPSKHRTGKTLKTLSQRLKGKEGRFRSNLSGKRVDFSSRTVISPDPNIAIDEVGIPIEVAMKLTVPERVTEWNKEWLKELVKNGPGKHPGALYLIRPDNARIRLDYVMDREKLADSLDIGYVVERHLVDGDIVIFNRQPSLHRISILGHRVKVLPYRTFRINPSVCPPYNADFDGDEMNLHVPQSTEASTEAKILLGVQSHFLSPRYGGPIIGAIRDFITGAYLLTRKETLLNKSELCSILYAAGIYGELPKPTVQDPVRLWSGKQAFSMLLPKELNFVTRASICHKCDKCKEEECQYDAYVIIKKGKLLSGVIDQASIGAEKSETLLHRVIRDYGPKAGQDFLVAIINVVSTFLQMRGFTYSFGDLLLPEDKRAKIAAVVNSVDEQVQKIIDAYKAGTLERVRGLSPEASLEAYIMDVLSDVRTKAGNIASRSLGLENSGVVMTRTGARGSELNIGHMIACLGQQHVRGQRIHRGYKERALPCFKPGDIGPLARGFISTNFLTGLRPTEFFYHAMGGREGLVDTAVRTQQSGYLQRRLINAIESLRVEYDNTVRDPQGNILEFRYGDDGIDPAKSDHGKGVNVERLVERLKLSMGSGPPASKELIKNKIKLRSKSLPPKLLAESEKALEKYKIPAKYIDMTLKNIVSEFKKAAVEPGEAVGIVAAQSIGEPGTQMTLRTFHYAGVKEMDVTLGLSRLIEILDARKTPKTPMMTIYLDKKHSSSRQAAAALAKKLVYTTISDVASVSADFATDSIVITPNEALMKDRDVKIKSILKTIETSGYKYELTGKNLIRITHKPISSSQGVKLSSELVKIAQKIGKTPISGLSGVNRVTVSQRGNEWVIFTDGSNFSEVLMMNGVDPTRTTTNNIHEIAEVLGIEAARMAIIDEIINILTDNGLDVDIRHIMLVASAMTHTCYVRQIGRHGISGEKASILARAAFERTIPVLINGALGGEVDKLQGMTERVLVGEEVAIGTGLVELYMNFVPNNLNDTEGMKRNLER
ncbi:MAG: DNA-directed RNA polymerase subunit A' [Thermoproteota archaeon]